MRVDIQQRSRSFGGGGAAAAANFAPLQYSTADSYTYVSPLYGGAYGRRAAPRPGRSPGAPRGRTPAPATGDNMLGVLLLVKLLFLLCAHHASSSSVPATGAEAPERHLLRPRVVNRTVSCASVRQVVSATAN